METLVRYHKVEDIQDWISADLIVEGDVREARKSTDQNTTARATWKLGFLHISEYLARYDIWRDPSVTERR